MTVLCLCRDWFCALIDSRKGLCIYARRVLKCAFAYVRVLLSWVNLCSWQDFKIYHWHKLPQYHFCCNKHVLVMTNICYDRSFVMTNIFCCNKHNFVMTKVWSWQAYFYLDKRHVLTKEKFCCDKYFVTIDIILSQQRFCCSKHTFVSTKVLLQQKWYLWQLLPMLKIQLLTVYIPLIFLWIFAHCMFFYN